MNWKYEIYDDDGCETIKTEYDVLLGVGKSDDEIEDILMKYCLERTVPGTPEEGRLWLAMALTQWRYGRLTQRTKEKALEWLAVDGVVSDSTRQKLAETLHSPMGKKRRFGFPVWLKSCPWPEGSLLAYRIISIDKCKDHPFGGKYVLLRIVEMLHQPYTFVAPEIGSAAYMRVALYNWCGDEIPDASIAETLDFIPQWESMPGLSLGSPRDYDLSALPEEVQKVLTQAIGTAERESKRRSYCCQLDWKAGEGVFTYLGCDPNFRDYTPEYIWNEPGNVMSHCCSFDATLLKRLPELYDEGRLNYTK